MNTKRQKTLLFTILFAVLLSVSLIQAIPAHAVTACGPTYEDDNVKLGFPVGSEIESVTVNPTPMQLPGQLGTIFDIVVIGDLGEGDILVCVKYSSDEIGDIDPETLFLVRIVFPLADVNRDGRVN